MRVCSSVPLTIFNIAISDYLCCIIMVREVSSLPNTVFICSACLVVLPTGGAPN